MRIPQDMTPAEFGIMVALRYNDNNKKVTAHMLNRSIRRIQQVENLYASFMSREVDTQ